jgi:A/G-specific adenine glycosylase
VQSARSIAKLLVKWFRASARDLPWRKTRDPYAIWVSEVMLQQTQVKTVIPYWTRWMTQLPNVRALAGVSEERLLKLWEGLGYYRRARHLQRAAQTIVKEHNGKFPCNFEAILALPGVGRYTAGAVCSIAFDQPHPVLDGNVVRVLTRLFGIPGNPKERRTNEQLWQLAASLVAAAGSEKAGCSHLNQSLMELGAIICLPQAPKCEACPVRKHCIARATRRVDRLPNLPARTKVTARRFLAFIVNHRDRFLVRQRPDGVVNERLWEFPNVEITNGEGRRPQTIAEKILGMRLSRPEKIGTIRHSITRYRIEVEVLRGTAKGKAGEGQWLTLEEIDARALTSAHRKVFNRISKSNDHAPGNTRLEGAASAG